VGLVESRLLAGVVIPMAEAGLLPVTRLLSPRGRVLGARRSRSSVTRRGRVLLGVRLGDDGDGGVPG
jgi:hypothetical protein